VLFLDEFLEFPRACLDCLRQPLEDGTINISRAAGTYTFPAEFTLIAATNPCPCGFLNDPEKHCKCSEQQVQQYGKKLSGPMLDRMDLVCSVPRLPIEKIATLNGTETSAMMIKRVMRAKQIQLERYKNPSLTNARLPATMVQEFCITSPESEKLLHRAFAQMSLSGRAYHKLLKVSRTIADLDGDKIIEPHHIAEALQYRMKTPE
jgi:magnesium chelatase family protein